MEKRLTRRFIIKTLNGLNLSNSIRYERYYINDNLRIQLKNNLLEKETLNNDNIVVSKEKISKEEFSSLKEKAYKKIIRDSYLYLEDKRISIKKYYDSYFPFIRVEIEFSSKEEMVTYQKESWMGQEITDSPLGFDKYLSKLNRDEFIKEIDKYL